MIAKAENMFAESNTASEITDKDYQLINESIETAKAFARSANQCVYIVDFFKKNFLYISENFANLCGLRPDEIMDMGFDFYMDYTPKNEHAILAEISKKSFELFCEMPLETRQHSVVSFNRHILCDQKEVLVSQHCTPIKLAPNGHIWLALCTITMPTDNAVGNILMKLPGKKSYLEYSRDKHEWTKKEYVDLSQTEWKILALSAQGCTMDDIATKLFKSIDTVKANKKSLFFKLGAKNIVQALALAIFGKAMNCFDLIFQNEENNS